MNVLKNYCDDTAFEWQDDTQTGIGYINDFPLAISSQGKFYQICLFYDVACDETLLAQLVAQKSGGITFKNGVITLTIAHQKGPSIIYIASYVQRICTLAAGAKLMPAKCTQCGGDEHLRVWKNDADYTVLCINCRTDILPYRRQEQDSEVTTQNFVGALFGGLVGLVIYVVLYQIGDFAAILGAVVGFCVVRGYSKKNNDFSKRGALMCISISFMTLIIAEFVAIGITIYVSMFMGGVSIFDAFAMLPQFLSYPGALRTAIFDVLSAYLTMLLIHLWWFLRQNKKAKK